MNTIGWDRVEYDPCFVLLVVAEQRMLPCRQDLEYQAAFDLAAAAAAEVAAKN